MQHRHPQTYPDPMKFVPDRWLASGEKTSKEGPEKYFVPFGRGSRICLGQTLAWAELYLTLGTVMRRFGRQIKLDGKLSEKDFYPIDDNITGYQRPGTETLRVVGRT